MNINKMKQDASKIALEMHKRFPTLTPELVAQTAKFIVMSANAITEANQVLATEGKEVNQKGYELVFKEVGNHIFKS